VPEVEFSRNHRNDSVRMGSSGRREEEAFDVRRVLSENTEKLTPTRDPSSDGMGPDRPPRSKIEHS